MSVELQVIGAALRGVAEEMGAALVRSAVSPNIKERRDCSTAVFDARAALVAQAAHIPVHLGAMPAAVAVAAGLDPGPGDVIWLNDPFSGGTHLPDVTLVSPVDLDGRRLGYTASRAHWADMGGIAPGSMPATSRRLRDEGLILPPLFLARAGVPAARLIALVLANTRRPDERAADLRAQIACHAVAADRLAALAARYGPDALDAAGRLAIEGAERATRAAIAALPDGSYEALDVLEGDGTHADEIAIHARVTVCGDELEIDLRGCAPQQPGNVNCPRAVAVSACLYAVRVVTAPDAPASAGALRPITILTREGTVVHARPGAAVAAGNVETSCRIADVVLSAFGRAVPVPAQGQGTMNNLTLGSHAWTFYETLGGGQGACPTGAGPSGVHVSMSNTLNTPVEALEHAFPLLVGEYALRRGSGGAGTHAGGDGVVRSLVALEACRLEVIAERRRIAPAGAGRGEPGQVGRTLLNGLELSAKASALLAAGDVVRVETPGGGGYGPPQPGRQAPASSAASSAPS